MENIELRDYFAAKAMQAMVGNIDFREAVSEHYEFVCKLSFDIADEMIKTR